MEPARKCRICHTCSGPPTIFPFSLGREIKFMLVKIADNIRNDFYDTPWKQQKLCVIYMWQLEVSMDLPDIPQ
jgi:hypothetical protein